MQYKTCAIVVGYERVMGGQLIPGLVSSLLGTHQSVSISLKNKKNHSDLH